MIKPYFKKTCGQVSMEGQYGGHPHWHTIACGGVEFRHLQIDDIKDLKYLAERAIEHAERYGYKEA